MDRIQFTINGPAVTGQTLYGTATYTVQIQGLSTDTPINVYTGIINLTSDTATVDITNVVTTYLQSTAQPSKSNSGVQQDYTLGKYTRLILTVIAKDNNGNSQNVLSDIFHLDNNYFFLFNDPITSYDSTISLNIPLGRVGNQGYMFPVYFSNAAVPANATYVSLQQTINIATGITNNYQILSAWPTISATGPYNMAYNSPIGYSGYYSFQSNCAWDYQLLYMNKFGAIDFIFGKAKVQIQSDREDYLHYNKAINNSFDRNVETIFNTQSKSYSFTTEPISPDRHKYIDQLLQSDQLWILTPENVGNQRMQPVSIDTDSIQKKTVMDGVYYYSFVLGDDRTQKIVY